jgi:hypothetical protein
MNAFYPFHVAFASFGDASSETALCFGRPPLSEGESTFLWVASYARARRDALTPFSDPDAHTLPMLSVRPAKRYTERVSKPPAWIITLRFGGRLQSL